MKVQKIKNRGVLFTYNTPDWDVNIYLILGKKFNYIIDTGLGIKSIEPIMAYIKNFKQTIVINTHYHWDHVWGNCALKDCIIISHKLCRDMVQSEWDEMIAGNSQFISGEAEKCLPNLVFENELYFAEDKIRIIYTPGHTIDCISVLDEEEGVLFAGDNIGDNMDMLVPDIDCDKNIYIETLNKYEALSFDTCLSGHNVILNKDIIGKIKSMV